MEIDGYAIRPVKVSIIERKEGTTTLKFVLSEGRNRQIRRMCEAVGLEVARLRRTSIGPLKLGMLKPGAWRELTPEEKTEVNNYQSVYSMYGGETEKVTLEFENGLLSTVIDRFGEKIICTQNSDHTFYINVEVQISPTFWGWLFKFGKRARVLAPENVVEQAKQTLDEIRKHYE